jgi:hypothetical protein
VKVDGVENVFSVREMIVREDSLRQSGRGMISI